MTLGEQFTDAVARAYDQSPVGLERLPEVLAQSCVAVLGVSGAGISMVVEDLRVPLGASDETAAHAERLQVTLGEGPCLDAIGAEEPRLFDLAAMAQRWPAFHQEVVVRTPFRAIASLPIRPLRVPTIGALDLYSTQGNGLTALALDHVTEAITGTIAGYLFEAPSSALERGITLPVWLGADAVTHRMDVWLAVGTLMELASLTKGDALAAIRAYARAHQTTLDDVAQQIVEQELEPQLVLS